MSQNITRLSQLQAGKSYKLEADESSCTIAVFIAGTSPVCVVYGTLLDVEQTIITPITMQLVGWMAYAADVDDLVPLKDAFMHFDEKPSLGALVGAWHAPHKDFRVQAIALEPTITEL